MARKTLIRAYHLGFLDDNELMINFMSNTARVFYPRTRRMHTSQLRAQLDTVCCFINIFLDKRIRLYFIISLTFQRSVVAAFEVLYPFYMKL